ncbi:beta-microseminoprotein-like [Mixophyes fleayi]|uniref:beta-microseminoprotein-like n=1 Tax=Mixophyes fleayi TaxID=3061075 RepID=UPI003F4DCC8F
MKCFVAVVFGAGFFLTVCNGACFFKTPDTVKEGEEPIKGCFYKDELHGFGSNWITKNCYDCSCNADGSMRCCSKFIPTSIDNDECVVIKDIETCTTKIVYKDDHTKKC